MLDSASIMTCDCLLPDVELGFGCGPKRCGLTALILGMAIKSACCGVSVYIQLGFQGELCVQGVVILVALDVGDVVGKGGMLRFGVLQCAVNLLDELPIWSECRVGVVRGVLASGLEPCQ
jgi:hypothetical protein